MNLHFMRREEHWAKVKFLLMPFALLFSSVVRQRRLVYSKGLISSYKAKTPIISIGNLSVGGTGKTPFTIFLARYLQKKGYSVAVSHRGYRGKYEHETKLISDKNSLLPSASEAGDEPMLLARNLPGIPVIVGKNRAKAIQYLENSFSPDIIILDDSFQHLSVYHDFNFVLFNAQNPFGNGFLLPAGTLREPLSALRFADCIVFSNCDQDYEPPTQVKKHGKPIIKSKYTLKEFVAYHNGVTTSTSFFYNKRVALLSGIGNPCSFEYSIRECGINFVEHYRFPDHYNYVFSTDIQPIIEESKERGIEMLITTEKDFVKMGKIPPTDIPIYYAKLSLHINEPDLQVLPF
ncbi:MAG: tetraacyldisaccharide 4'-kinase [Candidatus Cloacimonadia bacterium]